MKKIKILMIDDEAQFRKTTKKILTRKGFDTLLAKNGNQAIALLEKKPDVVILDIKMPGMDGHQVLTKIKRLNPQLPVIMLTGHGTRPSAKGALTEGAFDYLTKPCDIDLLSSKILDAYHMSREAEPCEEKKVKGVMIPFQEYTAIEGDATIREAIEKLKKSFASQLSTSRLLETGHRSVLVTDGRKKITGILTIAGLLHAIMPAYLSAPKPSTADSIEYSPMFWDGMFSRELAQLAKAKVRSIMSPAPISIEGEANIMEAAFLMVKNQVRRLVVKHQGEAIGVIREQDLFFEMEKLLRE